MNEREHEWTELYNDEDVGLYGDSNGGIHLIKKKKAIPSDWHNIRIQAPVGLDYPGKLVRVEEETVELKQYGMQTRLRQIAIRIGWSRITGLWYSMRPFVRDRDII